MVIEVPHMQNNLPGECEKLADLLKEPVSYGVFSGFDGFIDEVIHVVDQRRSVSEYTRIETIAEYAARIAGAAGFSTNIEYVPIRVKSGGNGVIYANALAQTGNSVFYAGALGEPIETVFLPLREVCREVVSIAPSAHTDAVEFQDGKLIISKLQPLNEVTYERLTERIGREKLIDETGAAEMLAFANWTMIPAMSDIWKRFIEEILPFAKRGGYAFFDLADPKKRRPEHVLEALRLIMRFQDFRRVVLGLNLAEARQVAALLELEETEPERLTRDIREALGLHGVVVHSVKESCAFLGETFAKIKAPYCTNPVLTTGAGDNFNAGFSNGLMRGLPAAECLMLGTATAGYYVRTGQSPGCNELRRFLCDWGSGSLRG